LRLRKIEKIFATAQKVLQSLSWEEGEILNTHLRSHGTDVAAELKRAMRLVDAFGSDQRRATKDCEEFMVSFVAPRVTPPPKTSVNLIANVPFAALSFSCTNDPSRSFAFGITYAESSV
jgi:hypothetical protein